MLYAEAMEDLFESPKTERNPRDGLNPLTPEPTLPELGPGDIKIIVEAPKEPKSPQGRIRKTSGTLRKHVRTFDERPPKLITAVPVSSVPVARAAECKRARRDAY